MFLNFSKGGLCLEFNAHFLGLEDSDGPQSSKRGF